MMALAIVAQAQSGAWISGEWSGTMLRGGDQLAVRFSLSASPSPSGTFSAPDLGAIDVPLQRVRLGQPVHWELAGDTTTTVFDGRLNGNTIVGTFSENGRNGTFSLHRETTRSQSTYEKRNVTFRNGDTVLAGTLYVPNSAGLHPAMLFLQGSGDEGRWASAYLADYVARRGIVALTYDKRGVGASSGNWRTSTMSDLANDATAGIALLAQSPGVDRNRIGLYGHSQGGEIAPAVAASDPLVSFVIAADGPVGPEYLQDIYRVNNYLAQRYSGSQLEDAKRLYREFVDVARSGSSHERLRADERAADGAAWLSDLAIPGDDSWIWPWYARNGNYDNRAAWANVRVPVLVLFGGKDSLVPVDASITQTVAILKNHGNFAVAVRIFGQADHTLHVPAHNPDGWPHLPSGFPQVIPSFVGSLPTRQGMGREGARRPRMTPQ